MSCPHDPRLTTGPIGMYHCPECGEMVVAGLPHPDYDREFTDEDYAVIAEEACWIDCHGMHCERGTFTDVGLAIALGRASPLRSYRPASRPEEDDIPF